MATENSNQSVVVIGAGLTGSLVATYLASRGMDVQMYEAREDCRGTGETTQSTGSVANVATSSKRSINLALSCRGEAALAKANIDVSDIKLPMRGRSIHSLSGEQTFQKYGLGDQAIYSISRLDLNCRLLDAAEAAGVAIYFGWKMTRMDAECSVTVETRAGEKRVLSADLIIGSDGAYSAVRRCMMRLQRVNFSQHYIQHGYKELAIPPTADGEFALPPCTQAGPGRGQDVLHLWPRGQFMLIALPNTDKSYTCTLFAPFSGASGLDALTTPALARSFMQANFPDAVAVMPTLDEDFFANPTSSLVTVRTEPWNMGSRLLLLGDAAHAVVPFFGQGMNAGFGDCLMLQEALEGNGGDLAQAVLEVAAKRKPMTDALADLSMEHYIEMRDSIARPTARLTKTLGRALHWLLGDLWRPLYSLVSFSRTPYHTAVAIAARQDALVTALASSLSLATLAAAGLVGYRHFLSSSSSPPSPFSSLLRSK